MGIFDLMISNPRYELSTSDYYEACGNDGEYKERKNILKKR